jgi:hypothetical protein
MPESLTFPPEQELAFFGAPPLLKGEDPNKYNQLLEAVSSTVEPADIFERAFVGTIVNLIWEANRYRRLIADTLAAAEQEALERLLRHLLYGKDTPFVFDGDDPDNLLSIKSQALSRQYVLKRQAAVEEVDAILTSAGLDWEVVKAEAFSLRLREIESLNRMIAGAEARMKTTLREIDRHRKGLGQQLRTVDQFAAPVTALDQDRSELKRAA